MKKYKTWIEKSSRTESIYFNWDFTDEELKDEFETEIGYTYDYSIRLSQHKRPSVVDGYATYEHKYFYNTKDEEIYNLAVKYLTSNLDAYCNGEIDIEELDTRLFNISYNDLVEYEE